ncbi:hypothetical protein F2P81_015523 [Scophthalmus maximus]|uniref:Uncharacterized protein n=1 Tax=Scophthalmus maximus TaxID=52904 RepID=A0A6A4SGH5_SCOMX|nr:hypothetical protein F2P81_015523 [Scophthalmus maximus]
MSEVNQSRVVSDLQLSAVNRLTAPGGSSTQQLGKHRRPRCDLRQVASPHSDLAAGGTGSKDAVIENTKLILHDVNLSPTLRFVRLSVRLIPFDLCDDHPANFQVVLSSSCRVVRLIGMIRERVGIQTSRLEVFRSRAPTDDEARLPPERSLEECGFGGGPEKTPPEETLYYDYRLELTDCPVLNCDHYFRSTPDSLPGRLDPVDE